MNIFRAFFFVCVCLIVVSAATADIIYETVMKTSFPMGAVEVKSTSYLKGEKERTESVSKMDVPVPAMTQAQDISIAAISRLDKKLMWILDLNEKTYTEIDLSAVEEMLEKMVPEEEQEKSTEMPIKVEVTRLQKRQKIEGYDCEKVRISISSEDEEAKKSFDMTADLWIAEEKGLLKEIADFNRKMDELSVGGQEMLKGLSGMIPGGGQIMSRYQEKLADLDGFQMGSEIAIRVEGQEEPVMKVETRIQNIRKAKLEDSKFEIPEGFTKSESPLFPME